MEAVRDKWTDERLDDGFRHVDERFDRMEERFDATDARFDSVNSHFNTMNSRFDRMQHLMVQAVVGMTAAMLTGFIGIMGLILGTHL